MTRVLAGGVFNVVHEGHLRFLREAKKLGDYLVVVVASDRTAKRRKNYFVMPAEERKKRIERTGIPDRVVVGDDNDFFRTVEREKPDVIALGYDQEIARELRERIEKAGCIIARIKSHVEGYRTKDIMKKKRERQ